MSQFKSVFPKCDPKDKFIDVEINIGDPGKLDKLGIPLEELIQQKFGKSGRKFDFGAFDDLPEISRKNFLDSLKRMRDYISQEKQVQIDDFVKQLNLQYQRKEDRLDEAIKKLDCELYLESLKPKDK